MLLKRSAFLLPIFLLFGNMSNAQKKSTGTEKNKKYNWSAGISLGNIRVRGDVKSTSSPISLGVFLSKPFTKWFSLNLNYTSGTAKGLNTLSSGNFAKNPAWSDKYAAPVRQGNGEITYAYVSADGVITPTTNQDVVFYNYKTTISLVSLTGKFSFSIPKPDPFVSFHFLIGGGILNYKTKINATDANGTYTELFKSVSALASSTHSSESSIKKVLKDGMDKSYETDAERYKEPTICQSIGYGVSFTIKKRFVIGIEQSFTFIKTDLLDGQRWQEQAFGDAMLTRDFDYLHFNTINLSYRF